MGGHYREAPPLFDSGTGSGAWYHSAAPEEKKLIFTGKGVVHSLYFENKSAATKYVFVYDGTDTTGTIVAGPYRVDANSDRGIDYPTGRHVDAGLYIASSSSDASYSASGAADLWIEVGYRS